MKKIKKAKRIKVKKIVEDVLGEPVEDILGPVADLKCAHCNRILRKEPLAFCDDACKQAFR